MLNRFLYDATDARLIDGQGLPVDPELAERNRQRAKDVIRAMGEKWCCHNPNPPRDPAGEEELMQSAHSRT